MVIEVYLLNHIVKNASFNFREFGLTDDLAEVLHTWCSSFKSFTIETCLKRVEVNGPRCFFRHLLVRWIVQESPIYHRVEESLLYQNPLSVISAKFSFPRYTT